MWTIKIVSGKNNQIGIQIFTPNCGTNKKWDHVRCKWEDPFPKCVSTTGQNWWDQYEAWALTDSQQEDSKWVWRNMVIYDYCKDSERYPKLPEECSL